MNEAVEHLTDPVGSEWPIYDGNSIHITNRILITSHQTLLYFVLGVLIGAGYTSLLPLPTGFGESFGMDDTCACGAYIHVFV